MRKPKYPKYTREQDLRCKLSDNDIKTIEKLYFEIGWSKKEIAKKFNVVLSTITYWCLSPEQRKTRNKKYYAELQALGKTSYYAPEETREIAKKSHRRKRVLMKKELREYSKKTEKIYLSRPEVQKYLKEHLKEYLSRPEVKKRLKEYYSRPEQRERHSQYWKKHSKVYYSRPEVKEHIKERQKKYMQEYLSRPEVKQHKKEYDKEYNLKYRKY